MKAIACILSSILLTVSGNAWTPPIGVPAPNWPTIGNPIDLPQPAPPADWTNPGNHYFVQQSRSYTFAADASADTITTSAAHNLLNGQRVRFTTSGTLPAGLAAATSYYVQVISPTAIKLYSDLGLTTLIDLTAGTGAGTYEVAGPYGEGKGTPMAPAGSIPGALGALSVIWVNGVYEQLHGDGGWYINAKGTASAPLWILGWNKESKCIATRRWIMADCSFVILDGIHFYGPGSDGGVVELSGGVDHVCFRNCDITGRGIIDPNDANYGSGSSAYNASGFLLQSSGSLTVNPTEQIVWYNCKITKTGNWQYAGADEDPDAHSFGVGWPVRDIWIVDCEMSYTSGCAVQLGTGSIDSTPDASGVLRAYVGRCNAHHIAQSAIWSKRSNDCVFSQNTVHTIRRDCPSSPNSGGLGCQYGPRNLWMIANTVYNCQSGIKIESGASSPGTETELWMVGNVIYNIHDEVAPDSNWRGDTNSSGGTCIIMRGGYGHTIVNNTFHDYDAAVLCARNNANRVIEGNIFSGRDGSVSGADINLEVDTGGLDIVRNNIFQEISGSCWIKLGGSTYTTVASLNAVGGLKTGNSKIAPSYVNSAGGNFDLGVNSNGIDDMPTEPAVYGTWEAAYPSRPPIRFDRRGGARPWSGYLPPIPPSEIPEAVGTHTGNWDIGAHEFQAGGTTPLPPAEPTELPPARPSGLHVKPSN